jgi:hypothetical protein
LHGLRHKSKRLAPNGGRPAITFNAAGLSKTTKKNNKVENAKAPIKAYVLKSEAVNRLQRKLFKTRAEGAIIELSPKRTTIPEDLAMLFDKISYYPNVLDIVRIQKHFMDETLRIIKEKCP